MGDIPEEKESPFYSDSDEPRDPFPAATPSDQGDSHNPDFASIAPPQHVNAMGHDTYTGIPGDGVVPG